MRQLSYYAPEQFHLALEYFRDSPKTATIKVYSSLTFARPRVAASVTSSNGCTGTRSRERQPPWNRFAQFIPKSSKEISYIIGVYMGGWFNLQGWWKRVSKASSERQRVRGILCHQL